MPRASVSVETNADFLLFLHCMKDRPEVFNIILISIRISIRILIEEHESTRSVQGLDILKTVLGRGEQFNPGILKKGFQPLLLESSERHGRFIPDGSLQIPVYEWPSFLDYGGRNRENAFPKSCFLDDIAQIPACQSAGHCPVQNKCHGIEVAAVNLTEQHLHHLRRELSLR